jgi:hypothetical protein
MRLFIVISTALAWSLAGRYLGTPAAGTGLTPLPIFAVGAVPSIFVGAIAGLSYLAGRDEYLKRSLLVFAVFLGGGISFLPPEKIHIFVAGILGGLLVAAFAVMLFITQKEKDDEVEEKDEAS